ncbi:Cytochrome P450 monooxygenase alt2 [Fulvia fulva]|uniref:Cytochrome P450 monooxygenase alt2 n=1 Tax=Passalora fulva TaxID=5499 RepID=A0A9Q8L7S8_PASFU|nr:Cytochrome P450 monooxygenase alt2 [Fulvia fulva]KAK4635923.1 Cytochrome P450 monooxygenase alt2 [Fulvia fulva]KAK4637384.1 Cytochrome P450 monooxygenase alt2 [Fulvia fulva]UJO12372.1 Cytochrome P450 monooxygenase alt2 [Fulvia fulva]WPV08696.1 Cytochrome P450 monooxygenase alt2 [Fulvia fulva]WPV23244.1 Cytochrome P450 monooxygenase alt2 [Fulvia fulva]
MTSSSQVVLLLLSLVAYAIANKVIRWHRCRVFAEKNDCKEPHGISGHGPLAFLDGWWRIGRVQKMLETGEDLLDDIFADQFKDANTIEQTQFEGSKLLATIEPANIQAMLATQFNDFGIGSRRINMFYPLLGNSIFSSDGQSWAHARALFRPQFSREQINDLDETENASRALINAIGPVDSAGWTNGTELQPLLYSFTLDTATSFLFGESLNSLSSHSADHDSAVQQSNQQFAADFELASVYMIWRIRLQALYWVMDGIKLRQAAGRIRRFTERFVQSALDSSTDEKSSCRRYNLLSALATQTQNKTELRNQTLAILVAGRDTTAGLLGWCFIRLALHPHIFTKLRSIILSQFQPDEPITFASVKGCRYLQHFLNEVLRLHPNVPINSREALKDTTLPTGGGPDGKASIAVPKGRSVTFSVYLMHRRKDLWGDDALEFRPERWEQRIAAWQYLPFSGGPRICIGQQFALTEASYVLIRMLQQFDAIEPVDRAKMAKMRKQIGLTMWPGDQVHVRMHKA